MEAEVWDAELLHDFETSVSLILCDFNGISTFVPWELLSTTTELVATFCTECVPPCHSEAKPILHWLAHDHLLGVIVMECHWIL